MPKYLQAAKTMIDILLYQDTQHRHVDYLIPLAIRTAGSNISLQELTYLIDATTANSEPFSQSVFGLIIFSLHLQRAPPQFRRYPQ